MPNKTKGAGVTTRPQSLSVKSRVPNSTMELTRISEGKWVCIQYLPDGGIMKRQFTDFHLQRVLTDNIKHATYISMRIVI